MRWEVALALGLTLYAAIAGAVAYLTRNQPERRQNALLAVLVTPAALGVLFLIVAGFWIYLFRDSS
jgi:ABC-type spermidine/putrescine transport system permease subunit I